MSISSYMTFIPHVRLFLHHLHPTCPPLLTSPSSHMSTSSYITFIPHVHLFLHELHPTCPPLLTSPSSHMSTSSYMTFIPHVHLFLHHLHPPVYLFLHDLHPTSSSIFSMNTPAAWSVYIVCSFCNAPILYISSCWRKAKCHFFPYVCNCSIFCRV